MPIQPWETNPAAVAYEFITAGGMNSPEQVTDLIGAGAKFYIAREFTEEAFQHWNMHVSREDFYAACLDFIADRPDIAENDA